MTFKPATLAALSTFILLTGVSTELASAHSGRTNSSRCHHNRRTGGYHCHNSGSRPSATPTAPTTSTRGFWTVRSVGDGDTLRVSRGEETITVRLACIDLPEMAQAHGNSAKTQLQTLLPLNTPVSIRTVNADRYGRTVAEVFSQERNINLSLVESGHAVVYRQYLSN